MKVIGAFEIAFCKVADDNIPVCVTPAPAALRHVTEGQCFLFQKTIKLFLGTLIQEILFKIMEINIFWGDLTDVSVKKEVLVVAMPLQGQCRGGHGIIPNYCIILLFPFLKLTLFINFDVQESLWAIPIL